MASSSNDTPRPKRKSPAIGHHGRYYNVYDAVAGRVTTHEDHPQATTTPPTTIHSARDNRLAPEDVLFRHRHAPIRYQEDDFYWAHEALPSTTGPSTSSALPPSALVKSMHSYASHFYEAMAQRLGPQAFARSRTIDERSMDETALLAFGILIEEAGREGIGARGDLVFTEGEGEEGGDIEAEALGKGRGEGRKGTGAGTGSARLPKRRKVANEEYVEERGT